MAEGSLAGLSGLTLLVAAAQTGFGPFVAVRLTASGWTQGAIGTVLSAGTIAAMAAQVPAGALVDSITAKRSVAGAGILAAVTGLLLLAATTGFVPVLLAQVLQGVSGVVITLAIAAITLRLVPQAKLGERLGLNGRYGAIGSALAAVLLGATGSFLSSQGVFLVAAAAGMLALLPLRAIHPIALATAPSRTSHAGAASPRHRKSPLRRLLRSHALLVFMVCAVLFHLGNAALLPLAAARFSRDLGMKADLAIAAAVTLPQLFNAALAPWIGRCAQRHGRRIVLGLGFLAVPLRGVLFALDGNPTATLAAQLLDGVSAATFGVMMPLVVADITHRGGRFNLALGLVGFAAQAGASVSTAAAGAIADRAGLNGAFYALAASGLAAALLAWTLLPETAHLPVTSTLPASRGATP